MRNKRDLLELLGVCALILLVFWWLARPASPALKECPHTVLGSPSASLRVLYFETPSCVWCWLEEPVLESIKGDVLLERYDLRYCSTEAREYNIPGPPGFVFMHNGTIRSHYGYIGRQSFESIICGYLPESCA